MGSAKKKIAVWFSKLHYQLKNNFQQKFVKINVLSLQEPAKGSKLASAFIVQLNKMSEKCKYELK